MRGHLFVLMSASPPGLSETTALLVAYDLGESVDLDALFPYVYAELRRVARAHLRNERDDLTLATTDLVHEVYLRLSAGATVSWQGRAQFLSLASHAMRQMLVEAARRRGAVKRGGGVAALSLVAVHDLPAEARSDALVALDDALAALGRHDETLARVVECRFFGGMTMDETASALGLTLRTAERAWARARAYLADTLHDAS